MRRSIVAAVVGQLLLATVVIEPQSLTRESLWTQMLAFIMNAS